MDPDFGSRQKKSHQRVLESLWPQLLPLLVFGFFFPQEYKNCCAESPDCGDR